MKEKNKLPGTRIVAILEALGLLSIGFSIILIIGIFFSYFGYYDIDEGVHFIYVAILIGDALLLYTFAAIIKAINANTKEIRNLYEKLENA